MACWRSSAYMLSGPSDGICVHVVLDPFVLTVKPSGRLLADMSSASGPAGTLTGTPVVPGVAYGPALVVRQEVSAEAIARFGDGGYDDPEAALAAYDTAVAAVGDGFERRADKASGAAAEVLTASAGLARDKGLR